METVRLIAEENTQKADTLILLMGELDTLRNSMCTLFSIADPEVVLTFTFRYLLVLRYLSSTPQDHCLYLSSVRKRFLEQTLIELYNKVGDGVYDEIMALHAATHNIIKSKQSPNKAPHSM
jgi:hypothetical protein